MIQLDGGFARGGVEVRQRLVKEQHLHVVHQDARQGDALLLSAGQIARRVGQMGLHADCPRGLFHPLVQRRIDDTVVFQRKGDIFGNRHADELPVRVLQYGAHRAGDLEEAYVLRLPPAHAHAARALAPVGVGDQAVDAVGQRGLAAAGGAADQHLFPFADRERDVVQRRLGLGVILEGEMIKLYDRIAHGAYPFVFKAGRRSFAPARR